MLTRTAARIWVILAIAALTAVDLTGVPADRPQARPLGTPATVVPLPPGLQLTRMPVGPFRTEVALAPDGSLMVFSATPDGSMEKALLFKRPLDGQTAVAIPGSDGACMPFFSPDSQWIGFFSAVSGNVLKVAVKGGTPSPIGELDGDTDGLSWGSDGRVFFGTLGAGIGYLPAAGGAPAVLTTPDTSKEATHRLPHVLPGGKALLFTSMTSQYGVDARVEVLSLQAGTRKVLIEDGADARYVPTGHLVFVRRGTLMAVPFSLARLETTGAPVTVATGLMHAFNSFFATMNSAAGQFAVSDSGALLSVPGGMFPDQLSDLYWVDRAGRPEKWTTFGQRPVMGMRLSPDGQRLAFGTTGLALGIWVHDIRKGAQTRLINHGQAWGLLWTPDGKRVVYAWSNTQGPEMWWAMADGSAKPERLDRNASDPRPSSFSPDGKYLAFVDSAPATSMDILLLRVADRQVTPFVATKANEAFPEFSPDGRWLAYVSNESGRNQVYVRSFPDGKRTLLVSRDGGMSPVWGPDGRELFYWDIAFKKLMKVDVVPGEKLSAGSPAALFAFNAAPSGSVRIYSITPDGRRFLVRESKDFALPPVTQLNLVRNWSEELKRLSPAGK